MSNSNAMNNAANGIREATEAAARASDNAGSAVKELASGVGENVRSVVVNAGHAVGDGYHRLADKMQDSYQLGRKRVRDWEAELGRQIQRRPVSAFLVAVGFGVAVGYLIRGKRR